jgi:ParB family chromosome partitioning protein
MALGKGLNSLIAPSGGNHNQSAQPVAHPAPISYPSEKKPLPEKSFYNQNTQENFHTPKKPQPEPRQQESIFQIETEKIVSNPYQPRKVFDEEELADLAESIREHGIIQPLIVSKVVKNTERGTIVEYQLIAGERRLKAARLADLPRVPVIVRKMSTPKMKLELALIENLQRSQLNAIESARAYARLQDEFNLTQKEIALRVGKSREGVANTMRLLNLPSYIQDAISEGKINESQARNLLILQHPQEQRQVFERMLEGKMSVRKVREHISAKNIPDPERAYWEKKLEEKFGVPISIARQGTRGKLTAQFYSEEEFNSLIKNLLGDDLE